MRRIRKLIVVLVFFFIVDLLFSYSVRIWGGYYSGYYLSFIEIGYYHVKKNQGDIDSAKKLFNFYSDVYPSTDMTFRLSKDIAELGDVRYQAFYAEQLKFRGRIKEAIVWLEKFESKSPGAAALLVKMREEQAE